MKRTFLDRFIGFISPTAEARRMRSRLYTEMSLRAYDAAQNYNTSDWVSATKSDPNAEIKTAQKTLRERSRDLSRNNPYAVRALDVIVSNTVGAGIVPNIRGKTDKQSQQLRDLWKLWAESTLCDAKGRSDFYTLQALVLRSVAESGEVLPVFRMNRVVTVGPDGKSKSIVVPRIDVLESDFIVTEKDEGNVTQGVEFDNDGQRVKYYVYKSHPGGANPSSDLITIDNKDATHVFRQSRPGQVRGVPWSHAVIGILKDLDDYHKTTLIRQKVAACFSAFITTNNTDSVLTADNLKAKRQTEFSLEPATVRYLNNGEDVKLASPPGVEGYSEFMRESLRAAAAGFGVSYEAFTGDYSQVNYSSGRMGHIEFRRNIDSWRWNMLIPQFCTPAMNKFLEWARTQGVQVDGVTVDWTAPAHTMIDPTKEISAMQREVRSGFKTLGEAIREQGRDPDATLLEYAEWNKKLDDLKIALDTDPRRMSQIGFAQAGDALSKLSPDTYLEDPTVKDNTNNE